MNIDITITQLISLPNEIILELPKSMQKQIRKWIIDRIAILNHIRNEDINIRGLDI